MIKLKKHVKTTMKETNSLKANMVSMSDNLKFFEKHTIGVLRNFKRVLKSDIKQIECTTAALYSIINYRVTLETHLATINNALNRAIMNPIGDTLDHDLLDLKTLKTITEHAVFEDTIFIENPSYLYGLGRITIIDIDLEDNFIHMVIDFPSLKPRELHDLYKVGQTGLYAGNGKCMMFKVPPYFFRDIDGVPRTTDLSNCRYHFDLIGCTWPVTALAPSCIEEKAMNCRPSLEVCQTYQYVNHGNGIILRDDNNNTYYTLKNGHVGKVVIDKKYMTANLDWGNLRNVFLSQKIMINNPHAYYNVNQKELVAYNVNVTELFNLPNVTLDSITAAFQGLLETHGRDPSALLKEMHKSYGRIPIVILGLIFSIVLNIITLITLFITLKDRIKNIVPARQRDRPVFYTDDHVLLPEQTRRGSI